MTYIRASNGKRVRTSDGLLVKASGPTPVVTIQGIPAAGWQVGVARSLNQATVTMTNISQAFLALHDGSAQVGARQAFTNSATLQGLSITPQTANTTSALQAWTAATGGTMLDSDSLGTVAAAAGGTPIPVPTPTPPPTFTSAAAYTGSGGAENYAVPLTAPSYTLPSTIAVGLMSHGADDPTPMHTSAPGIARGQLFPTQHLATMVGGTLVPIQQDSEVPWSDGSIRTVVTTWPAAALTDGVESMAAVQIVAGAPDRTPFITPQALVALKPNLEFRAYGLECGNVVYATNLKQIVDTAPRDSWGTNPLAGWDVPMSGPHKVMVRVWQYRRDTATGNRHKWIRDTAYLSYDTRGNFETAMRSEQPNWYGPVAGATLGGTTQKRCVHYVELWDGSTRVRAWGGPYDPRVAIIPATAFKSDDTFNRESLPAQGYDDHQCVTFAAEAGGTLPSGILPNTPYWLMAKNYGTTWEIKSREEDDYLPKVTFGTAGSGNIRVIPAVRTAYGSGPVFADTDGLPIRLNAPRVRTTVRWDEIYMSHHAKLFPPYNQGMLRRPSDGTLKLYYPGQMPWGPWLNGTGDDAGDNRIGYINNISLQALLRPHDVGHVQRACQEGTAWSDQPIWWRNPATGRILVADNGPNDNGTPYPELGAGNFNATYQGGQQYGSGWLGRAGGGTVDDDSAYRDGYSSGKIDGTHCPNPWTVPYHLTGHPLYGDQGLMTANAVALATPYRAFPVDGTMHYNIFFAFADQVRGAAWNWRQWDDAESYTPGNSPERAYVKKTLDANVAFSVVHATPNSPVTNIGAVLPNRLEANIEPWMNAFLGLAVAVSLWRGERPTLRNYAEKQANFAVGFWNDASPTGGTAWLLGRGYHARLATVQGGSTPYASLRAAIADQAEYLNLTPPFPATGFAAGIPYNTNAPGAFQSDSDSAVNYYGTSCLAYLAMAKSCNLVSANGDDAGAVYSAIAARINAMPGGGIRFSSSTRTFPRYAIVPVASSSLVSQGNSYVTLTGVPSSTVAGQPLSGVTFSIPAGGTGGYLVLYKTAGAVEEGARWSTSAMPGNLTLLIPQTAAGYTIRLYSAATGGSLLFESTSINVTAAPGTLPTQPTQTADTGATQTGVTMNWTATATNYRLLARSGVGSAYGSLRDTTLSTNSYTFTGLSTNSSPRAIVIPQNANGYGLPSVQFLSFLSV